MNNKKLEKMLDKIKATGSNPSEDFINLLKSSEVIVPALMPQNTSPEIIRSLVQNAGKALQIPEGAHPQPCVLENGNGQKFLPIFTSEAEMKKNANAPKFPIMLNLSFEKCIELIRKNPNVNGAVINPYTHNVVFHVEPQNKQPQSVQVTIEQFHFLTRQKMEAFYLPKNLFDKREELIEKLRDGQGNCLKELYEEIYDTEVACPYVPEDFEFMCLNITEELMMIRITMPSKYQAEGTCPCVLIGWNKKENKIWYYSILLTKDGKARLHQRLEDGTDVDLGEAPSEGSELTTVIDLIQSV